MTNENEKAISIIMKKIDFSGTYANEIETSKALCTAVEALKKRTPIKPIKIVYNKQITYTVCPCCYNADRDSLIDEESDYCKRCGQAIDWSE